MIDLIQLQYDMQYPDNEQPDYLTCYVCHYDAKTEHTYTVNGEILCAECFADFCDQQYDDHGEEFFEDNQLEYVKDWWESLEDDVKNQYMLSAFETYMSELITAKQYGDSTGYDCTQATIRDFVLHHSEWPYYIMRTEEVLAKSTSPVGTQKSHGTRLPINGKGGYIEWKD